MDLNTKFLDDQQLLGRIYSFVLFALVVILLATLFSFWRMTTATDDIIKVNENREKSNQLALELRLSSNDLTRMARSYVMTGNKKYLEQYQQVLDIRNGKMAKPVDYYQEYWQLMDINNPVAPRPAGKAVALEELFKQAGFTNEEFEKLKQAKDLSNNLAQLENQAFELIEKYGAEGEGEAQHKAHEMLFGQEYSNSKRTIMEPISQFIELMETRLDTQKAEAESSYSTWETVFFFTMTLAILLIGAVFFLARRLNRLQLDETLETQEQIKAENEKINNSVINILQSVSQLSQKDLTIRAPVTDDVVGTVSDSINYLAEETGRVMQEVKNVAGLVKDSSSKVKLQADQVSKTADEERTTIEEMTASLLEATKTMEQVAHLAEETNTAGQQATEVTENALETVNDTVQDMESIRTTISETEKRIKRLGERSQEISGIVNLINTISERTHVLALNASMQAAVAGEAGRGFAVVAEEVQRLAESSQNATRQIESLVNNIQIETNETINTVNHTISQVVEGSEQAQKAGEQMRETQKITAQLVEQVRFISEASDKQKEMAEKLLHSAQLMGESTTKTASQIELQNTETDSLQQASDQLVETVSVFKLPNQ